MNSPRPPELRLVISRERLRVALQVPGPPSKVSGSSGWLNVLQSVPCTRLVLEALTPIAQRNPLGLMLTALAAGALLTWAKPWRWSPLSGIVAGVLPEILAKLVAQVPPSTWLDGLDALFRRNVAPEEHR
jgi:hypothetical protein